VGGKKFFNRDSHIRNPYAPVTLYPAGLSDGQAAQGDYHLTWACSLQGSHLGTTNIGVRATVS
jgi:hypothetical protein